MSVDRTIHYVAVLHPEVDVLSNIIIITIDTHSDSRHIVVSARSSDVDK